MSDREAFEKELYEHLDEYVPKRCPGCGEPLVRITEDGKIWIMPYGEINDDGDFVTTGFDCWCDKCEWSGNIEPDSLTLYPELVTKKKADS